METKRMYSAKKEVLRNRISAGKIKVLFILLSVFLSGLLNAQDIKRFANPILSGFYPDPSICRAGDDYYLVTSTFSYFPGIPVFRSRDLVNWQLIGHVLDRPEQLNLDGQGVSRGLFAPAIRYDNGIFYVTCTLVDIGGNFVVTTKDPAGPWSNPVYLPKVNGIDPSLFFDDNEKSYIIYNGDPPDNISLYDGHRTLRMYEFDKKLLKVTGDEKIIINGGVDISKKPIWIEAPHIYKINGEYYLMAAEGGTADWHSEVIFKSKNVWGPYIPFEKNPILTQRNLDKGRSNPVTSAGHADMVQTQTGDWWAVFLACRPYSLASDGYYNLGRETFLAPVKWTNGWPIINPDFQEVQFSYPYPLPPKPDIATRPFGGNFMFREDFNSPHLEKNWMFLRTPEKKWYDLKHKPGFLTMQLMPETCSGLHNPAFLGHRQQHLSGYASVGFNFTPEKANEKAGLAVFQNEQHYYYLCVSTEKGKQVVQLYKSQSDTIHLMQQQELTDFHESKLIKLKIRSDREFYSFYYSLGNGTNDWILLADKVDGAFLSTKEAGGFVGCVYALYATSLGKESTNKAEYDWFEYSGEDNYK